MAAELYRHTDKPDRVNLFREDLRSCHLPASNSKRPRLEDRTKASSASQGAAKKAANLWGADEWAMEGEDGGDDDQDTAIDFEGGDELLAAAGLAF